MSESQKLRAARRRLAAYRALSGQERKTEEARAHVLVTLYSIETGIPIGGEEGA